MRKKLVKKNLMPTFTPGICLPESVSIVTDDKGIFWRIDAETGTMRKIIVEKENING